MSKSDREIIKFIFQGYTGPDMSSTEIADILFDLFRVDSSIFDWKDGEEIELEIQDQERIGKVVREIDDGDDTYYLLFIPSTIIENIEMIFKYLFDLDLVEPDIY
jgi:hypothetical protein